MLYPGLPLKLTTDNPLYKGSLDSTVLSLKDGEIIIASPLQDGRLTLLPVGTLIQVRPAGSTEEIGFQAEILSRTFQPERTLTITLPHAISRSGRSVPAPETARVIAVTSGKGGVGKTTLSINLGIALQQLGFRVCLVDVDLGTANVEFLLNLQAPYNIAHLLAGEKTMDDILVEGPEGLLILPGTSGLEKLANLTEWQYTRLVNSFNRLDRDCHFILLDTGAGISANVTNFLMASDEILLVTNPDPHAVLDAYALIKTICGIREKLRIRLIVNRVSRGGDEARVKLNLLNTCRTHLGQPLEFLGSIPDSKLISHSIREMKPFVLTYPDSEEAALVSNIARRIGGTAPEAADGQTAAPGGLRRFFGELQKLFTAEG